jgi:hypothetical protein
LFYVTGTYSVINNDTGYPMHGIGPDQGSETTRHLYYQWVPFYLFFLSMTFYSPHFFWKAYEKGKLKKILVGMEYLHYSVSDSHVGDIPSRKEREEQLNILAKYIWCRIKNNVNSEWAKYLFASEIYALLHAVFAYALTDVFLGGTGAFYGLTLKTSTEVFPTMSKCLFHKYGPSGSIQKHDALCVLALNIVNEKVFYMLHFWFPFVVAIALAAILWRLFALCFYRNIKFNRVLIRKNNSLILHEDDKKILLNTISYWDWIFMCYLAGNSDGFVFQELYAEIAECIRRDGTDSDDDSESTGLVGKKLE